MTTQHPAREAGQRWHEENYGDFTLMSKNALGSWLTDRPGESWEDDCWSEGSTWKMTLLSDAPPAPKVDTVCKAPEGYAKCTLGCGNWAWRNGCRAMACNRCVPGPKAYNAKYPDWTPPLESKSAPPVQEAPKVPACCDEMVNKCSGTILLRYEKGRTRFRCEWHYLAREAFIARDRSQSGKPYAGPERLQRPKMASSYGLEDPALEDAP